MSKFIVAVCILAILVTVLTPFAADAARRNSKEQEAAPAVQGRDYNPFAFAVLAIFAASITWFVFRGVQRA